MPNKKSNNAKSSQRGEPEKPSASQKDKQRVHIRSEEHRQKIFQKFRDLDAILWGKVQGPDGFTERGAAQKEILG